MKRSIISENKTKLTKAGAVLFWLLAWQALSAIVGHEILLASPASVAKRLLVLIVTKEFWQSIAFSAFRIALGFILATFAAILLSLLSSFFILVRILLSPLVQFIKATPVASIVIVVLIWVSSRNLSVIISFMMVFPVLYTNLLAGIEATSKELLEMATVFRLPLAKRFRAIYLPSVVPYFLSSSKVALGLAWKSGVAAEVIGIPVGSIGEKLYQAKLFFATADVLAWTVTIIVLSVLFEKGFTFIIERLAKRGRVA